MDEAKKLTTLQIPLREMRIVMVRMKSLHKVRPTMRKSLKPSALRNYSNSLT